VDRLAELFVFAGMVVYFGRSDGSSLYPLLAVLAAGGSFLVSYTRARAEGLGVSCSVGWMERPERLVVLLVAIAFGSGAVRVALWALTVLTFFTAAQRMNHVYRETRSP
jgi:CDP-diacylglycerol--glycerol-3-phosphate 3-phosphatidyltransferase